MDAFSSMLKLARQRLENQEKALREAADVVEAATKGNLKALKVAAIARAERVRKSVEATREEVADLERLVASTVAQELPLESPGKPQGRR